MAIHETKSVNGVDLFVVSSGQGTPVVVVHGGPGLGHSYLRPALEELANHSQVIAYDQRDCGCSSALAPEAITLDAHLHDLEGLRQALDLELLNLVGHSFGAHFALLYAAQHPARMSSLVLANPGPPFVPEMLEMLEHEFAGRRTPEDKAELEQVRASAGFMSKDPHALEQYFRSLYRPFFKDRASVSRLELGFTETTAQHVVEAEERMIPQLFAKDPVGRLRDITCPTIVLHAEHDLIPEAFSRFLAEQIRQARYAVLPDVGHFAFLEAPSRFRDAIVSFLRENVR